MKYTRNVSSYRREYVDNVGDSKRVIVCCLTTVGTSLDTVLNKLTVGGEKAKIKKHESQTTIKHKPRLVYKQTTTERRASPTHLARPRPRAHGMETCTFESLFTSIIYSLLTESETSYARRMLRKSARSIEIIMKEIKKT